MTLIHLLCPLFLLSSLSYARYRRLLDRWHLNPLLCTRVRGNLSFPGTGRFVQSNASVSAPEQEYCFLILIGSPHTWSRRTVAEWRGLRMRSMLLLRHGHLFAENCAHCQSSSNFPGFYYTAIYSLPNLFYHRRGRPTRFLAYTSTEGTTNIHCQHDYMQLLICPRSLGRSVQLLT